MSRKVFRKLASIEEALETLERHFNPHPIGSENTSLERAAGRVLAEHIAAPINIPPFDRAAVDGYAVRAEDTYGADEGRPRTLKVVGKVAAGDEPKFELASGEAVEISTGAPIPIGANAVVMFEHTWRENAHVNISKVSTPGENIIAAGSDIPVGERILRRGTLLTYRETAILAALGITHVPCFIKPKVAVLSTGDELKKPGEKLDYGQIYDVNSRMICDAVTSCGCEPIFMGLAKDDFAELTQKVSSSLKLCDVVVVSGGTSAGSEDLLYRVTENLGSLGVLVHGIAVKPGKPTMIGVVAGKPVFGLPGYPTSAMITFKILVQPTLRRMAGLKVEVESKTVDARIGEKIYSVAGCREYVPVSLTLAETGGYVAYPVLGGSGIITSISKADGIVEVPESVVILERGETVRVQLFSSELRPANLVIAGSYCVGVDLILDLMLESMPELNPRVINVGFSGGLVALSRGEADIAGVNIFNPDAEEYNLHCLKRYGLAGKIMLVRGYFRTQGLLLRKGNPKSVKSLEDLLDGKVSMINREPGSGARLILDHLLQRLANSKRLDLKEVTSKIIGYSIVAKSDIAVAMAVMRGTADVGLATETTANLYGLDFIPLAKESYDFAILKGRLTKPAVKLFVDTLGSEWFKSELPQKYPGLTPTEETGKMILTA
ncbi:MAG: molybdopterin biosynthesis protein [Candidatus Bathyarchaeia archaeon]